MKIKAQHPKSRHRNIAQEKGKQKMQERKGENISQFEFLRG